MTQTGSHLDSLVEKIYNEGIERSNKEAENIVSKAKEEADNIIASAKKEAEKIISSAKQNAADVERSTKADLSLAAEQAVSALKQRIKELISVNAVGTPLKEAFVDKDFLKQLILAMASEWKSDESVSDNIEIYFPESMKGQIDSAFTSSISASVDGVKVDFNGRLKTGFTVSPAGGKYQISFTDEDFIEFFKPFIKSKTESILFSEDK